MTRPPAIADDGHERRAALVIVAREQPPHRAVQAERLVIGARDERAGNSDDRTRRANVEDERTEPGYAGKDLGPVSERADDRIREALGCRSARLRRPEFQLHQVLRVRDREPSEHQRVNQAEDGGVGADAQRQRQHDDKREAWSLDAHPEGVANVSGDLVEQRSIAVGPHAFLRWFDPSEVENGQTTCVTGRRAIAHLVGGGHLEKGMDFVVQIALGAVSVDEPSQNGNNTMQDGHASSGL